MEELPRHPSAMDLAITVRPELSVVINYGSQNYGLWQVNLKHKIAYNYSTYAPNQNYWNFNHTSGISEQEEGLCWWNGHKWQLFEEEIQEAYSNYIAEKEILGGNETSN